MKPILMASPFISGLEYVSIKNWVGRVVVILILVVHVLHVACN